MFYLSKQVKFNKVYKLCHLCLPKVKLKHTHTSFYKCQRHEMMQEKAIVSNNISLHPYINKYPATLIL
jgi:hypothetical protein